MQRALRVANITVFFNFRTTENGSLIQQIKLDAPVECERTDVNRCFG